MIINITQHCTLRCEHCMQCAGPERSEYINEEMFDKALQFAQDIHSTVINISGGEPTSHPLFFTFLEKALKLDKCIISVLSNGTFLKDSQFVEKFSNLVKDKRNFFLQISSFKGIYDNYDHVHKPQLKALKMFGDKVSVSDKPSDIKMMPLGRAATGKYYEEAKKVDGHPSCTNSCLILAQMKDADKLGVGNVMERFQRFCLPIVDWKGDIRLGESIQCKIIANIEESIDEINKKLISFRPCGGCASYKWHFENPTTTFNKQVCAVLCQERFR